MDPICRVRFCWLTSLNVILGLSRSSAQVSRLHCEECMCVDKLLLVVDRGEIADRLVAAVVAVVTVHPGGLVPDQLVRTVQGFGIVIEP